MSFMKSLGSGMLSVLDAMGELSNRNAGLDELARLNAELAVLRSHNTSVYNRDAKIKATLVKISALSADLNTQYV